MTSLVPQSDIFTPTKRHLYTRKITALAIKIDILETQNDDFSRPHKMTSRVLENLTT